MGGSVCVCVDVDARVSGCVSTVHPPPYLIPASVSSREREKGEATDGFLIVYRIGILWVSVL